MKRRDFLTATAGIAATLPVAGFSWPVPVGSPIAITMWEFSWIERQWPGAGYENWDLALDELAERGYNAIRIDAFPHLFFTNPEKEYMLEPLWNAQEWGSPGPVKIKVFPALNQFIAKCAQRNIKIGLSSWFRQDTDDVRMQLDTPAKLGTAWLKVLDSMHADGLLDTIVYVDLCNEWTGPQWCPFFVNDPPQATWGGWDTQKSRTWMEQAISVLRSKYPDIPYTFSFTGEVSVNDWNRADLSMFDLLELHIWMTSSYKGEFYKTIGYRYDKFSDEGYKNMQLYAEKLYIEKRDYWHYGLKRQITNAAEWSLKSGLPLGTTECWGVVDYKDWPLLSWDWVKELCSLGVYEACKTGRWLMISTSNFCGPQFTGMWRDIGWHRKLTSAIKSAPVDEALKSSLLFKRIIK